MERQEKIVSRLGFIGRERDLESDYFALGARMCDAETGRFLSVDPLFESFDAHTPYHYAYNSPIKYKDPSGLMTISDVETGKQILNALYGEKQQWLDIEIGAPGGFDEEQSNWDNLYFQDNYELDPWDYLSTGALYLSYGGGGASGRDSKDGAGNGNPKAGDDKEGDETGRDYLENPLEKDYGDNYVELPVDKEEDSKKDPQEVSECEGKKREVIIGGFFLEFEAFLGVGGSFGFQWFWVLKDPKGDLQGNYYETRTEASGFGCSAGANAGIIIGNQNIKNEEDLFGDYKGYDFGYQWYNYGSNSTSNGTIYQFGGGVNFGASTEYGSVYWLNK